MELPNTMKIVGKKIIIFNMKNYFLSTLIAPLLISGASFYCFIWAAGATMETNEHFQDSVGTSLSEEALEEIFVDRLTQCLQG